MKVINFKYGLSIGQIVLLKVVIKTAARRSEVWDSTGCADTCPCHHHNSFELAFSNIFCNVLQSLLADVATASSEQPSYATTSCEGSWTK